MKSWTRKNSIENLNKGKHVTIGSRVVCTSRTGHQFPVSPGTMGKVLEAGKANPWASKKAIGTTESMRVDWDAKTNDGAE